jgi:hypothetical protein
MSETELLLKKVAGLPPDYMAQIFDFIDQLKQKALSAGELAGEPCTPDDCPLYAENPPFNAKVLAAIQEGRAMMRGEIPTKWYHSPEDLREALSN